MVTFVSILPLVLPHLNSIESYTLKYGRVSMMNMECLLLIMLLFSLLTVLQVTGQHKNWNQIPCFEASSEPESDSQHVIRFKYSLSYVHTRTHTI